MNQQITVEIPSEGLGRELWSFYLIDDYLVLNEYLLQIKPSKRHRIFQTLKVFTRTGSTQSYSQHQLMAEENVPWPDFVLVEAKRKFCEQISVVRWKTDLKRR
jgi:hypothetical protein